MSGFFFGRRQLACNLDQLFYPESARQLIFLMSAVWRSWYKGIFLPLICHHNLKNLSVVSVEGPCNEPQPLVFLQGETEKSPYLFVRWAGSDSSRSACAQKSETVCFQVI